MFISCLLIFSNLALAQKIEKEDIDVYVSKYNLHLNWPTEIKTKIQKIENKPFSPTGISLYFPSEKIQIIIEIVRLDSSEISFPNLKNGTRLSHYASNEENSIISLHSLGDRELELLNAEWATQAIFRPKKEFSNYAYCQLISFYSNNKPQVFVYFLFDDAENPILQRSFSLIQFF